MKNKKFILPLMILVAMILAPIFTFAQGTSSIPPSLFGIRIEFIIFALTLVGVALFHKHTMYVALIGLTTILLVKLFMDSSFNLGHHIVGGNNSLLTNLSIKICVKANGVHY